MRFRQTDTSLSVTNITGASATTAISLDGATFISAVAKIAVNTPTAGTFTAASGTDILTATAHGFQTGLVVRLTTTGGLPAGLATATDYFVIFLSANTYALATTRALALAGTRIDFTTNGTGTQTATPTALAGASVRFFVSNDGITYVARDPVFNITASGNILLEYDRPGFKWCYLDCLATSGMFNAIFDVIVKSNRNA